MRGYREGDRVRLLGLPDWLLHDLPLSEQKELREAIGRELVVKRLDTHGYIWLEISRPILTGQTAMCSGHSFCVTPDYVEPA